ncbi:hypothetical protein M408DRAFT_332354 [Serendipita vermifera MAFF 305830]|uniref:Uncharacterized protein n=1 Tax=Serendipita vermifera MAFF 305830 TaxID=933852 RepID=A0A0C2X1S3_SERVB|nr:hypothetical protein M408DRAFT_332354 [Serendipita vermifera MAFF 305830]
MNMFSPVSAPKVHGCNTLPTKRLVTDTALPLSVGNVEKRKSWCVGQRFIASKVAF